MTGTRVTCEDLDNGDTQEVTIQNDYVVITDGNLYVDGIVSHSNGTTVITLKREKKKAEE